MRSVWFVTPAWKRVEVTRLALAQRSQVAEALVPLGLDVRSVVVADDENLDAAREYGCDVVELDNDHGVGRRFNAGFEYAAEQGADLFVYLGSDDWLHPDAFAPIVEGEADEGTIVTGREIAFVDLASGRLQACRYRTLHGPGFEHGIIPWIFPREVLEPVGFRPLPPKAPRGLDHLLTRALTAAGVRPRWLFHDPPLGRVDFKSRVNLNGYARVARPLARGPEVDAWPALVEHYPAALVDMARDCPV